MKKYENKLKKDLLIKSVVIPLVFVVITIITCLVFSNPRLEIFPSSDKLDASYSDVQLENDDSVRGLNGNNE